MGRPSIEGPLRVAVVGAGPRSTAYTRDALHPSSPLRVVAVVDPNPLRRNTLADAHDVPADHRFASYEDLAARPGLADAVINATLDIVHYASTVPLLRAGFHVLLEKPIAPNEQQVRDLIRLAREHDRVVMVCHILRYDPFYQTIKRRLEAGAIGPLVSIHTVENMSYDHVVTTYLRHPRNLEPAIFPMLLSKCCHDLDLIAWLTGGLALQRVASMIKPTQFRPENAPIGSTERCLGGCAVEDTCRYSARSLYVENGKWDAYPWPLNEYPVAPPAEEKLRLLATSSPYGRCAWRCPSPAIDQQSVLAQFVGGVTATHDLYCATSRAGRTIRIVGTDGEIEGDHGTGQLVMRLPDRRAPGRSIDRPIPVPEGADGTSAQRRSEQAMIADFIGTVRADPDSAGITRIEKSLVGHQIAFAADLSAREGRVVSL